MLFPVWLPHVSRACTALSKHGVGIEPPFWPDFWDCGRACARGGVCSIMLQHVLPCFEPFCGTALNHVKPCYITFHSIFALLNFCVGPLSLPVAGFHPQDRRPFPHTHTRTLRNSVPTSAPLAHPTEGGEGSSEGRKEVPAEQGTRR